ncbi:MAG: hypothetical protein QF888_00210, partial [Desulfobacterales bacterium]|nr:hypothetical protein [Desulfobacterales bacterium]
APECNPLRAGIKVKPPRASARGILFNHLTLSSPLMGEDLGGGGGDPRFFHPPLSPLLGECIDRSQG